MPDHFADKHLRTVGRGMEVPYALDDQEMREGMICVGVPIFDDSGTVAAVAVSMVKFGSDPEEHLSVAGDARHFARALSRKLGAPA